MELRLLFCTCGREKNPVRRKVRLGGSSGSPRDSDQAEAASDGGTLTGGISSALSRAPISTRSSSDWLPNTW